MDHVVEMSDVGTTADPIEKHIGTSQLTPTAEPASGRWLPAIREIRKQLDQWYGGRFQRLPHQNQVCALYRSLRKESYVFLFYVFQSDPPSIAHVYRCGLRLLMCCASLSPADFTSPVSSFDPVKSTSYYPTGDIRSDRSATIATAMGCLQDLDADPCRKVDVRVATKLFELAQALGDLGLGEYALNISYFALDILEGLHVAAPNDSRLLLASVLSLRGNIFCDMKRNDEAVRAAERAVTLCREHRDSQVIPVPELAYAMVNYAVLLVSIDMTDESAAISFELNEDEELRPEMKEISALSKLCLSTSRIGADDDMALSMAEEAIELSSESENTASRMVLAGAFLNKSKVLSSTSKIEAAHIFSAKAVNLLREMNTTHPVFSLFLAHALDTCSHQLMEADRNGDSYSTRQEAVSLWQSLSTSAPGPIARPLALSLFELARFRFRGGDKKTLGESLKIAESAVEMFRTVEPLDGPRLADALYLVADRMSELERNLEAAADAEESIHYLREASAEDQKYAPDLTFSLSLASSCLAFTDRANDALEYSKEAVEIQHGRKAAEDTKQYNVRLGQLLCEVVVRAAEMDKKHEASSWREELYSLSRSGDLHEIVNVNSRSGDPGETIHEIGIRLPVSGFKKNINYWIDASTDAPGSINGYTSPPTASRFEPRPDKGKGKANMPLNPSLDPSGDRLEAAEDIFSPEVAAALARQLGTEGFRNTGPLLRNILGSGPGSNSHTRGRNGSPGPSSVS